MPTIDAVHRADLVIVTASTSAVFECIASGVPTLVLTDHGALNLSPLRGVQGVTFVATPKEVRNAIAAGGFEMANYPSLDSMLSLNTDVPQWRALAEALEPRFP
jgi:surface carbohydrate biosynthesis protein (TIGR04326 family)